MTSIREDSFPRKDLSEGCPTGDICSLVFVSQDSPVWIKSALKCASVVSRRRQSRCLGSHTLQLNVVSAQFVSGISADPGLPEDEFEKLPFTFPIRVAIECEFHLKKGRTE